MTRSRSAAGSIVTLKSCGPEVADHGQVDLRLQLCERLAGPPGRCRPGRGQAFVELHQFFLPKRRRRPRSSAAVFGRRVRRRRSRCTVVARASWRNAAAASEAGFAIVIGHALVDGARDLPVARDEDVGLAAEHAARRRCGVMPTWLWARLRTMRDHARLAAHQLERLEPELRVLQRERVEHADEDQVGGGVDRRDHLRREPGRRVDDDGVVRRTAARRRRRGSARP